MVSLFWVGLANKYWTFYSCLRLETETQVQDTHSVHYFMIILNAFFIRLSFDYNLQCDEHYYDKCDRYCMPDTVRYTCSSRGRPVCNPGESLIYKNKQCDYSFDQIIVCFILLYCKDEPFIEENSGNPIYVV